MPTATGTSNGKKATAAKGGNAKANGKKKRHKDATSNDDADVTEVMLKPLGKKKNSKDSNVSAHNNHHHQHNQTTAVVEPSQRRSIDKQVAADEEAALASHRHKASRRRRSSRCLCGIISAILVLIFCGECADSLDCVHMCVCGKLAIHSTHVQ